MPNRENTCMFAMYVIGEVESGWDWTGVNRNDPITIGMMQIMGSAPRTASSNAVMLTPTGGRHFKAPHRRWRRQSMQGMTGVGGQATG